MGNDIEVSVQIERAHICGSVLELRLWDHDIALDRRDLHDQQIIANLYLPFRGRGKLFAYELRGTMVQAGFAIDVWGAAVLLYIAPGLKGAAAIVAGPALVDEATRALFGRATRQQHGRHPAAMRAARLNPDGTPRMCSACGERPAAETHHIQARADGGEDEDGNLDGLCRECHEERVRPQAWVGGAYLVEVRDAKYAPPEQRGAPHAVRVRAVGGPLSGRERGVVWGSDLVRPGAGEVYRVQLRARGAANTVLYAEHVAVATARVPARPPLPKPPRRAVDEAAMRAALLDPDDDELAVARVEALRAGMRAPDDAAADAAN